MQIFWLMVMLSIKVFAKQRQSLTPKLSKMISNVVYVLLNHFLTTKSFAENNHFEEADIFCKVLHIIKSE